ncbi:MAG: hypothetical protein EBQ57_00895 [Actinobacteria bacterium]|nr:hypothetical protein [Actinomycetota bacterium]
MSPTPSTDDESGLVGDTATTMGDAAALAGATGPTRATAATATAENNFRTRADVAFDMANLRDTAE